MDQILDRDGAVVSEAVTPYEASEEMSPRGAGIEKLVVHVVDLPLHRDDFVFRGDGAGTTRGDIERIAKHFRMKPSGFIETYLRVDEEGDHVLQEVPCAFLGADNYCSIYDVRPKACREFPHTDRKKFHQISHLTLKNVAICPAAYNIVEAMKERLA